VTTQASTSLVRDAARRLAEGPTHTLDLARDVLGLSGHAGAAAAAVFQLLGADPRFRVDGGGVWSLDPALAPLGMSLAQVPFAVVDVETTGGGLGYGHRITEFAVVEVRGGRIVDEYETLLNPGRSIPPSVTALTGITNAMVAGAPYFDHVAEEINRRLVGRVFVAHNATFDWSFVSAELTAALGSAPPMPRLCTVRMVRRFVPGLRRRNLDEVTRYFGVPVHARHRAHGDALATARVFLRLLDEARGRGLDDITSLEWYLRRRSRRKKRDANQILLALEGDGPLPRRSEG
jgi:DNA polymerase III subunit epsilon